MPATTEANILREEKNNKTPNAALILILRMLSGALVHILYILTQGMNNRDWHPVISATLIVLATVTALLFLFLATVATDRFVYLVWRAIITLIIIVFVLVA